MHRTIYVMLALLCLAGTVGGCLVAVSIALVARNVKDSLAIGAVIVCSAGMLWSTLEAIRRSLDTSDEFAAQIQSPSTSEETPKSGAPVQKEGE